MVRKDAAAVDAGKRHAPLRPLWFIVQDTGGAFYLLEAGTVAGCRVPDGGAEALAAFTSGQELSRRSAFQVATLLATDRGAATQRPRAWVVLR